MTTPTAEVQRGSFIKDERMFNIYASSAHAPDTMRVYPADAYGSIVLIMSGLNSRNMKASWGLPWRGFAEEWRDDFEERAYRAYVSRAVAPRPTARATATVRVCEG
jgi:hypothetical protein